jgi:MFS family permease
MEQNGSTLDQTRGVRWNGVLAGTFVFFALLTVLLVFGAAIVFSLVAFESNQLPSRGSIVIGAAVALAAVLLAFFVGGYVAGLPLGRTHRRDSVLTGLLVWAVVASLTGTALGGRLVPVAAGLFAGPSAATLVEKMNPRVLSDLSEGKVTSRVVMNRVPQGILEAISEMGKRRAEVAKDPALQRTASQLRRLGAAASWSTLLALIAGAASAALGALLAADGWRVALRGRSAPRARAQRGQA